MIHARIETRLALTRFFVFRYEVEGLVDVCVCVNFLSFFLSLLVRSYMSITPGSANLEILIK